MAMTTTDLEPVDQQEVRGAVVPAAADGGVRRQGGGLHPGQRVGPLPRVRQGYLHHIHGTMADQQQIALENSVRPCMMHVKLLLWCRPGRSTGATAGCRGTTTAGTGRCGSCPCSGAPAGGEVLRELEECRREYPDAYIRLIAFDSSRQCQCTSFVVHKPAHAPQAAASPAASN